MPCPDVPVGVVFSGHGHNGVFIHFAVNPKGLGYKYFFVHTDSGRRDDGLFMAKPSPTGLPRVPAWEQKLPRNRILPSGPSTRRLFQQACRSRDRALFAFRFPASDGWFSGAAIFLRRIP
jgi:hypothetical protein